MLLQLYHHLPAPLRSLAATLRGVYLCRWRYGPETERLVEEALAREHWSAQQWEHWQTERLRFVLHRAATRVPYYRDYWQERRRRGDRASWELLQNWPILEKDPLRATPEAFLADDCDAPSMFHEHTSGTTGKSLDLWWSRETVRQWFALFEARWRRWNGVSRHDRWAILGGQLVTPVTQRRPPFWVWNAAMKQLYLSSYHLAPDLIESYLEAMRRYRIRYLWGYSSSLYALAAGALRLKIRSLKMAVAVTNAEPLFGYQADAISEAFQCPVRETYGMSEAVAAASQCEAGRLHLWPEIGVTEIRDGDQDASAEEAGDLICTSLLNADMPLIRYRVGDCGRLAAEGTTCSCGRTLPVLAAVEGRKDDVLFTVDGRCIGRLDPVFKTNLPVIEAQIIQEALDRVRVRYLPAPDYTPQAGRSIIARLQERMGQVEVVLEAVEAIPRGTNGKFRAVICNLPSEERRRLEAAVG
jgi:phenylacetate-CoA ligase